jgi:hypothetical protein
VAGHEAGTFVYPASQPGGGNPVLRRQFRILGDFIRSFDFVRMRSDSGVLRGGVPPGGTARALVEPGKAMAVYVRNEGSTGPWSARWTGFIEAPASGEFLFHTYSNDGIRLWVSDQKLVDDWTDHSEKEDTGRVVLKAGERYAVRLEYFYNGGQGTTKLRWTLPGGKKEVVPANAFRLPDGGWGLRGQYYRGTDLTNAWATRDDGTIDFAWGVKPPFSGQSAAGQTALQIELPPGRWKAEWIDTKLGTVARSASVKGGRVRTVEAPAFETDIALRLRRQGR